MNSVILVDQQEIFKEERVAPLPGRGEVIVEVAYCGVCRTDRKSYRLGQRDLHMPRILGHEFSGRIVAVGEAVCHYDVGDRVAIYPGIGCGECADCKEGNDQRCREMQILGFHLDGGFSRYCRIPQDGVRQGVLCKIPQGVSLEDGAKCEPLGCAIHMIREMDLKRMDTVLIYGGGVLGVLMAMVFRHYGVEHIYVSEPNDRKRRLISDAGFVSLHPNAVKNYINEKCANGVDAVIPCCPYWECMEEGILLLKNGGTLGFFSGLVGESPLAIKIWNQIHYKELKMIGAYGCGKKDFQDALSLLESGFDLSLLPVTYISLDELEEILMQEETNENILTKIQYETEETI